MNSQIIENEISQVLPEGALKAYDKTELSNRVEGNEIYFWLEEVKTSSKGIYIGLREGVPSRLLPIEGKGVVRIYQEILKRDVPIERQAEEIQERLKTLSFVNLTEVSNKKFEEQAEAFYIDVKFIFSYPKIQREV